MTENYNFEQVFKELKVEIKECPFKLNPLEKPKIEFIKETEKSLSFEFPKDYIDFCIQIGGGHLGNVQIFIPLKSHGHPHSIFFHTKNHQNHIATAYKNKLDDKFKDIIIFAQETIMNNYFGWKLGKTEIYSFHKSGEIQKISKDFLTFVKTICLGEELTEFINENLDEDEDEIEHEEMLEFVPFPSMNN